MLKSSATYLYKGNNVTAVVSLTEHTKIALCNWWLKLVLWRYYIHSTVNKPPIYEDN